MASPGDTLGATTSLSDDDIVSPDVSRIKDADP
jgi:hypothetical protein